MIACEENGLEYNYVGLREGPCEGVIFQLRLDRGEGDSHVRPVKEHSRRKA